MFTKSRKYFIKTWPRFKTRMLSFAKKYNAPYQSQMLKDVLSVYSYPYSTGQKPSKEEFKKLIQAATEDKKLKKDIIKIRDKWVSLQRHLATKKTEDKPEMQFVVDEVRRLRAYLKQDNLDHFIKGIANLDKDILDVAARSSKARKSTKKPKATTTHRTTKPKSAIPGTIIKKPSVSEIPPKPSSKPPKKAEEPPVPSSEPPKKPVTISAQPTVSINMDPALFARARHKPGEALKEILNKRRPPKESVTLEELKQKIADCLADQEIADLQQQSIAAKKIFAALLAINAHREGLQALPDTVRKLADKVQSTPSNQIGSVYRHIRKELTKISDHHQAGVYFMLLKYVPEHLWVLKFVDKKYDPTAKQEEMLAQDTTSPVTTPAIPHKYKDPSKEELSLSRSLSHTLSQEILKKSRSEIIREIVIDDTAALDLLKQDIAESLARAQDKELNLDDVEVQLAALKHLYHVIYYANIIGQGLEFASANVHSLENIKKYDKKQIGKLYKQIRDVFYDFNKCSLADKVKTLKEYAAEQTWALMLVDKLHLAPEPKPGKKHS